MQNSGDRVQATEIVLSGEAPSGARVKQLYGARTMKVYPIHEHELQHLTYLNTHATVYFGVFSFLSAVAVSLVTGGLIQGVQSTEGRVVAYGGGVLALLLSSVFLCLGYHSLKHRDNELDRIRKETLDS